MVSESGIFTGRTFVIIGDVHCQEMTMLFAVQNVIKKKDQSG